MYNGLLVQFIDMIRKRKDIADYPSFAAERPFFLELADRVSTDPALLSRKGLRSFIFTDLINTIVEYGNFLLDPVT